MIRRPLCLLCLIFMASIWMMNCLGVSSRGAPDQNIGILEYVESHPNIVRIYGQIYRRQPDGSAIYLENSYLQTQSELLSLENVKVYLNEESQFPVGAGVLVVGKLQKIPPPGNPGQFDSVLYYKTQHIYYRMVQAQVSIEDHAKYSYREVLAKIRDKMYQALDNSSGKYAPVYQAMLLGDKSQLEDETRDRYQMAGILHILAISGLHLSLLGMGCYKLLMAMGASQPLGGSIAIFLLFAYGILTGEGVATMRALCMFVLMIGAKIMGRSYDLLSAAALSALLLLIDSPLYLFYSGFQLSFGCIVAMGLVYPKVEGVFPDSKNKKTGNIKSMLCAGVSIAATTLPITLYCFYEYPLFGMILNLVVIPAMGCVLVTGMLTSVLGIFSVAVGQVIVVPGCLLLKGYDLLGTLVQKLPVTTWVAGQPEIWQIVCYYVILLLAVYLLPNYYAKDKKKHPKGRCVVSIVLVVIAILLLKQVPDKKMRIVCLDIGQGDCLTVTTPSGVNHLIDGGSSNLEKVGRYRILPYLKSQGISSLDYVWISHTDKDHISGVEEILELQAEDRTSVKIENLMLPLWEVQEEGYETLEQLAKEAGVSVHYVTQGDQLQEGEVLWTVLWPVSGEGQDPNESSQVLLLEYGEFQGLFTGDIGEDTERKIQQELPDVDYLKVAHHGSRYSTGDAFLKVTRPEIGVISSSSTNTYGHPHKDTLERLEKVNCRVWCTKDVGAVTVTTDGKEVWVEGYLQ